MDHMGIIRIKVDVMVVKGHDRKYQRNQPACQALVHAFGTGCFFWEGYSEFACYSTKPVNQPLKERYLSKQIFHPIMMEHEISMTMS